MIYDFDLFLFYGIILCIIISWLDIMTIVLDHASISFPTWLGCLEMLDWLP